MEIREILNDFAKYIDYNPEQKEFNLFSNDYLFHCAGQKIEELLSGYDPTGILSVIYARNIFLQASKNYGIKLFDYLSNEAVRNDIARDVNMYEKLCDPYIIEAENAYIDEMDKMVQQVTGKKMIGKRNAETERKTFFDSVWKAIEDLSKCRVDIFRKNGNIGKIEKITTRILVFERMADCLLYIETIPDALYFCYINQYQSADGYFSFIIKSNGNLISVCDRIEESYIGQHGRCRNARWSEAHADKLFPYNFIFEYGKRDYKGYATSYIIDNNQLEFMNLQPEVYQPILVAMLLLKNKYEDREIEGEELYINTLMKDNYLDEHPDTGLMVLDESQIAVRNNAYSCHLPIEKILSGEYNKQFGFANHGDFWTENYGKGFVPDYKGVLAAIKPETLLEDQHHREYYSEYIGTANTMNREVYRKIRIQLAQYIEAKLEQEYDAFGGNLNACRYWKREMMKRKDSLIQELCKWYYLREHPETTCAHSRILADSFTERMKLQVTDIQKRIKMKENERYYDGQYLNNTPVISDDRFHRLINVLDDETGKKSSIFFKVTFYNFLEMEEFLGSELPKVMRGWRADSDGRLGYNGNSILDATDAVGEIVSPFYGGIRPSNGKKYDSCSFNVWLGFSKTGWRKTYESWLKKHGLEEEIDRKRKEKALQRKAEEEKMNLPAPPFKPSEIYSQYSNSDVAEQLERELYSISRELRIRSVETFGTRICTIEVAVLDKGNSGVKKQLEALGWYRTYRCKKCDGKFVTYYSKKLS